MTHLRISGSMGQVVDFEDGFPVVQFARGRWKGSGGECLSSKKQGFPWAQALHVAPGFAGYRRQIQHHLFEGELGHLGKLLGQKGDRHLALLCLSFAICRFWTCLFRSNQVLKTPAAIEGCLGHDYPQDTRLQEMFLTAVAPTIQHWITLEDSQLRISKG